MALSQIRTLMGSTFARSIGSMMVFTALGQSMYLLTGPLIGRMFSQAEFGVYGLFYTFVVTAVGLIFLNFDYAIPAADTDEDAHRLSRGALMIALVACPAAGAILAAFCIFDIAGFGALPLAAAPLATVVLLMQAIVQLQQNWQVRRQQTTVIGMASITLNVVRGASQVALGALAAAWWALAAGEALGRLANALHLARRGSHPSRSSSSPITVSQTWSVLHRYRQFMFVLLPAQVLDSMVGFIQSAGLIYLFGPVGLGIYFMMRRTLDMPVAFVFRSLSDVFYARLAQDARASPERVRPFLLRTVTWIGGMGLLLGLPVALLSPALFGLMFGEQWRASGVLAAIMLPATVTNLAVAPVSRIFALTSKPRLRFWFSGTSLIGTCVALGATYHFSLGLTSATACLSLAITLSYIVYFASALSASHHLNVYVPEDQALT